MAKIIFLFSNFKITTTSYQELNDFGDWLESKQASKLEEAYRKLGY